MIEIPKWLFYFILTFLILVQFPLSYILGMLLGEITLRRRRVSHPIPTQENRDRPNQLKHCYNHTHPTAITQIVEQNPNKSSDTKPNSESQSSQGIFSSITHLDISFHKFCIRVYRLFKRLSTRTEENRRSRRLDLLALSIYTVWQKCRPGTSWTSVLHSHEGWIKSQKLRCS